MLKMKFELDSEFIPGTILKKAEMSNVTGLEFLNKIFFISNGVMLAQIREITGIDGSTLQNWVKRGWIGNTVNKKYTKDQLARIIIINMLRGCMLLERIDTLLHYINGVINDKRDDIIPESLLYDYICKIYDSFGEECRDDYGNLRLLISEATADYEEPVSGARERLDKALEIIIIAYYASSVSGFANNLFEKL